MEVPSGKENRQHDHPNADDSPPVVQAVPTEDFLPEDGQSHRSKTGDRMAQEYKQRIASTLEHA